ncbi:MAG: AMP-binding protein, partial [Gammaproteobacteria bacterium]
MTAETATANAGFADLAQWIAQVAARDGARLAVDDGTRGYIYAEFDARATALARALIELGVRKGDRIAVLAENRIETLELAVACARCGAVLAALNWRFAADEIAHCVKLATPVLCFVSARHAILLAATPDLRTIAYGDEYEALIARPSNAALVDVGPEDGWIILYTSGTTGLSKAALLSHRAEVSRLVLGRIDSWLA